MTSMFNIQVGGPDLRPVSGTGLEDSAYDDQVSCEMHPSSVCLTNGHSLLSLH